MPAGKTAANLGDVELVQDKLSECIDLEMDDETGVLYWTSRGELPLGNTLNKKQLIGESLPGEKKLGHQIVSFPPISDAVVPPKIRVQVPVDTRLLHRSRKAWVRASGSNSTEATIAFMSLIWLGGFGNVILMEG